MTNTIKADSTTTANATAGARKAPRILVLDLGRGWAVLGLAIVHTLWMFSDPSTQMDSSLGKIIHLLNKGAAAFLVWMGMSLMLSRTQSFMGDIVRGIFILALAYMMNVLKFIVPIEVFGTMPEAFIEAYGWQSPLNTDQLMYLASTGDILQLAGISLLMIAFIRQFVPSKWGVLAIAFFILSISREVAGYQPGIAGLDYLADLFFAVNYHIYFPVVPWFSFILFGMFLGMLLKEYDYDHNRLFKNTLWMGFITMAMGGGLCAYNYEYHFGNYFHHGPGGTIFLLGVNFVFIWLAYILVEKVVNKEGKAVQLLTWCSQRITSIYIIQWVVICWSMGVVGFHTLNVTETLAMMPIMLGLTLLVQLIKDRLFAQIGHIVKSQNNKINEAALPSNQ